MTDVCDAQAISVFKNIHPAAPLASWQCTPEVRRCQVSIYRETEWMDKENRLLVFCVWAETEEEGWGKHSCEDRSDTSTRGSKVTDSPCANNGCHPPSSLSLSFSLSTEGYPGSSLGGRVHPLIDQATELAWHHSSSLRSLHLCWTSFCVGLDYGPLAPRGQLSLEWDNSQTRPCTHGNALRGYYASRTPFPGSSSKDEVKQRPRLNCYEWRSTAES